MQLIYTIDDLLYEIDQAISREYRQAWPGIPKLNMLYTRFDRLGAFQAVLLNARHAAQVRADDVETFLLSLESAQEPEFIPWVSNHPVLVQLEIRTEDLLEAGFEIYQDRAAFCISQDEYEAASNELDTQAREWLSIVSQVEQICGRDTWI